jgi:hypothetical protein
MSGIVETSPATSHGSAERRRPIMFTFHMERDLFHMAPWSLGRNCTLARKCCTCTPWRNNKRQGCAAPSWCGSSRLLAQRGWQDIELCL